jgi:signal transduction histidine kinase
MKTPLGTVRMTAEMLHDKVAARGDDPDSQRAAQRIVRQSIRLREIVDDLLTVARTESLDRVPDDLGRVVSALIHDHADSLPSNVEVRLELNGAAFPLELDSAQLTVALRNMLDNAVQAIGSRQEGLVRVSLTENTNALVLIVEDNGIGMSTGTLAKLFQPFYTERQGGSGIGTVIIKRVIEGHGGTIAIESERGKGTRFIITFHRA